MSSSHVVCGKATKSIPSFQKIIGGHEAPENTIPWQVLLSISGNRAGGIVIADRWILTAAHVVKSATTTASKENVRVRHQ